MSHDIQKWDPDKATAPIKLDPYSFQKVNTILQEIYDDQPGDERSRIETLRNLHVMGRKAWYLMGELLLQQKKILEDRYSNFKEQQIAGKISMDRKYTDPVGLWDWFETHKKDIPFSYKTASRYMNARICTDIAEQLVIKLGTSKIEVLKRAGKDSPALMEKAAEEGWTRETCEKAVDKALKKHKKERALTTAREHKELPKISIHLDKTYGQITIKTSGKYLDQLCDMVNDSAEYWKEKLFFENKLI